MGSARAEAPGETLPPLAVTATRTPTRADQLVAEVTVISREAIEQAAGRSLPELLSQQPGLQFSANGGLGKPSSVFVRGLDARHTLLLIDGVRYGSATTGTPIFDTLPLDAIERIEIVRGPLSSLYGSGAGGGVVQIFTRRGQAGLRANAIASVGNHGQGKLGGGFHFAEGLWDGAVQVGHLEIRGFSATNEKVPFGNFNPDPDGFRQDFATAQLGLKLPGDWRIGTNLLHSNGTSGFDDGPDADSRSILRTAMASIDLAGSVHSGWRTVTRVSRSEDRNITQTSASPFTDLGSYATVQQQFSHEHSIDTPVGELLLALDHLKQKASKPAAQYEHTERSITGVSAGWSGRRGAHTWQGSWRHDRNSQFGHENTGALGYGYDITAAWRVGASYGTTYVSPSFNQLYYPDFGNPTLVPEHGKSKELNVRYTLGPHQLRAAWFEQRIENYIPAGPKPENVPRTHIDGVSLSYDGRLQEWRLSASAEHVNPRNKTSGAATDGKLLPRRAKDSFKLGSNRNFGTFGLGGSLRAFGSRYDDVENAQKVAGFGTVDLHAEWRFQPQWSLGLNLNNLANKRYETVYGYNQPGREMLLTVRYAQR